MSLRISRILHAGYELEFEGACIGFDPIFESPFSRNCFAFPAVTFDLDQIRRLKWDALFISHFHDDHCSLESLDHLDRRTRVYIFCAYDELPEMIRQMGFSEVHRLHLDTSVRVGSIEITPRRAYDQEVDCLFQICAGGMNVLNVVDSVLHPHTYQFLRELTWDVVMWPFQPLRELAVLAPTSVAMEEDYFPSDWAEELQLIKPRVLIPSACQFRHEDWSWYNQTLFPLSYDQFRERVASLLPNTAVVRLDPSQSLELNRSSWKSGPSLSWVQLLDSAEVDYTFNRSTPPMPTAEIAMRLPPHSPQEAERALEFCRSEIPRRYESLSQSEDSFFSTEWVWSLTVFDCQGHATEFRYQISGRSITTTDLADISWRTEVPLTKLVSAIETGETLTSMYVRVDGAGESNPMEDPLIRCLFEGRFGQYHRNQLRRLKSMS